MVDSASELAADVEKMFANSSKKIGDLETSLKEKDAGLANWISKFKAAEEKAAVNDKDYDEVGSELSHIFLIRCRKSLS